MSDLAKSAAVAVLGPKIAKRFKFSWLVYGVLAYVGIRYLNKKGIMPKQTGAALNAMNRGLDTAKEHLGFKADLPQTPDNVIH